jgi:Holliday junction resolvasome RuvABC endonuclease subunit
MSQERPELGGGIAFDLSKTNTGVAVFDSRGNPVLTLERSYAKHRYVGFVHIEFQRDVYKLLGSHEPTWVAYEEVMPINKYHAEIHFGMFAILAMTCARRKIPLFGVNTGSMRKDILGNGRAKKGEVVEAMQHRFPHLNIPSHDVADALCVGLWITSRAVRTEDSQD